MIYKLNYRRPQSGALSGVCTILQNGLIFRFRPLSSDANPVMFSRIAELLTSLPSDDQLSPESDANLDSAMDDIDKVDPEEVQLEAQETSKYILAKSYFDCREYDRCAAVFLPSNISPEPLSDVSPDIAKQASSDTGKGKAKESGPSLFTGALRPGSVIRRLSQKALFLALYAKYISGEKKKNEEIETILGPADGGITINKELIGLQRNLEGWFADRKANGKHMYNQGWLEYLYGVVLIKGKSEEEGKKALIESVNLYPYNWSAWLELSGLLNNVEDVSWRMAFDLIQLTCICSSINWMDSYLEISYPRFFMYTRARNYFGRLISSTIYFQTLKKYFPIVCF